MEFNVSFYFTSDEKKIGRERKNAEMLVHRIIRRTYKNAIKHYYLNIITASSRFRKKLNESFCFRTLWAKYHTHMWHVRARPLSAPLETVKMLYVSRGALVNVGELCSRLLCFPFFLRHTNYAWFRRFIFGCAIWRSMSKALSQTALFRFSVVCSEWKKSCFRYKWFFFRLK